MGTWRHGQEGEGQAWCAKCGLLGATPGTSQGQAQTQPKVPGGQCPGVNLLQMESRGQGSWHHWPRKPQVTEAPLPMGSAHHIVPMQPGVWMGVGSLHCPSRYVNKGKKMSSQKPRVSQLETWPSRCGWGGGGNISNGWVGAEGRLSPRAQAAFTGSSKSPGLYSVLVLSENRSQP